MARSCVRVTASVQTVLLAAAVLVAVGQVSAQPLPTQQALPLVAPLPPVPPLPREGALPPTTTGTVAAPQQIQSKPGTATAFDVTQRDTIERLNEYFNSVRTLVGNFVQIGPDGTRSQGEFYLQKPGRVRFDYEPPSRIELIADGRSVAVRDRKLATQDLYPLSQTPLRFLLAEEIDLLKDTNLVGIYQDDLFITIVIEEKHAVVGTHRLMIMFGAEDAQLKQWTVTDPQGFDTTIAVFNLDTDQRPDPRLFRIEYQRMIE